MIYPYIAAGLIGAAVAATGTYKIQQWRFDSNEKEHLALHAAQATDLHKLEQARSNGVIAAVNLSRPMETKLRAESAALRNDLVGLRNESTAALSFARTSLDACTLATVTYDQLFAASTTAYTELAEQAQRHVIDIQTREVAWPK